MLWPQSHMGALELMLMQQLRRVEKSWSGTWEEGRMAERRRGVRGGGEEAEEEGKWMGGGRVWWPCIIIEDQPRSLPACMPACPAAEAWGRRLLATGPGCLGAWEGRPSAGSAVNLSSGSVQWSSAPRAQGPVPWVC